jgi:hypothetical protein
MTPPHTTPTISNNTAMTMTTSTSPHHHPTLDNGPRFKCEWWVFSTPDDYHVITPQTTDPTSLQTQVIGAVFFLFQWDESDDDNSYPSRWQMRRQTARRQPTRLQRVGFFLSCFFFTNKNDYEYATMTTHTRNDECERARDTDASRALSIIYIYNYSVYCTL